jgi:hypothetical protein
MQSRVGEGRAADVREASRGLACLRGSEGGSGRPDLRRSGGDPGMRSHKLCDANLQYTSCARHKICSLILRHSLPHNRNSNRNILLSMVIGTTESARHNFPDCFRFPQLPILFCIICEQGVATCISTTFVIALWLYSMRAIFALMILRCDQKIITGNIFKRSLGAHVLSLVYL